MILRDDISISVRKLGFAELEDYRDHLLRLDDKSRAARFSGPVDDAFLKSYCLRLVLGPTQIIGAFNRGTLRGACEIDLADHGSDENGKARLALSVETEWRGLGLGRQLIKESLITCFGCGAEHVSMVIGQHGGAMTALARDFGFTESDPGTPGAVARSLTCLTPIMAVA
ncbi:MAG: GNAT family N-acetyltransferase [Pseudomonadota bacterium]